jgi:hypothetical protein
MAAQSDERDLVNDNCNCYLLQDWYCYESILFGVILV